MKVVGLTGGIGSGKSTVAHEFNQLGIPLIDLDLIAKAIVEPGQPALVAIQETLGDLYIKPDGSLDRKKLQKEVFTNTLVKSQLEAILHPRIREEALRQVDTLKKAVPPYPFALVVIPLLAENMHHYEWLDCIIVVDLPETLQIERCIIRDGLEKDLVEKMIKSQASRAQRAQIAGLCHPKFPANQTDAKDFIIDNSHPLSALKTKVETLYQRIIKSL